MPLRLRFDHRWMDGLPGDPVATNYPRQVPGAMWSAVQPTAVPAPTLLAWSDGLRTELGLNDLDDPQGSLAAFAGNALLPGMRPFASNYGGHQFGHWAGQLGDGRAITLGEGTLPDGRRMELQLKGAGPTPYSRTADGRAVLRSSLREFICSEAMHALGVPTTRGLCLVGTGQRIVRDMFYDGHPEEEPGAIVCRVAPSFVRFGHFELPASRGETELLRNLVDFCIDRDFPELAGSAQARADWYWQVCERTAVLMAHWLRVGFVHGVMNTDNLSILGLTIDYGPYGWLEETDPLWTPNTTDLPGRRYCYGRQPAIAAWNLAQLAGALLDTVLDRDTLQAGLDHYQRHFAEQHQRMSLAKLGLVEGAATAQDLQQRWSMLLHDCALDFTLAHRALMVPLGELESIDFASIGYDDDKLAQGQAELKRWLSDYCRALAADEAAAEARIERMAAVNPLYVPRNYLAQQAIDAASAGDLSLLRRWQAVLAQPYREQAGAAEFARPRPEWARQRAGCSMLSCSS